LTNTTVIYTDGSCHTQHKIGAWAAIVFINNKKTVLSGKEINTTHNRMEILAVLKAIAFVLENNCTNKPLQIITDSQYVVQLKSRQQKLSAKEFFTKKGNVLNNADLIIQLFHYLDILPVELIKIKAHLKQGDTINYNIEVDKLARHIVRNAVDAII
jgi:ribonuclease HI